MRLPSGRFASLLAIYGTGHNAEALVAPENGDAFRIRTCHLRGLP